MAHDTQRVIYFGPPGTGKTTTLLGELERELQTTAPDRIAFLTFTRRARAEAMERVQRSLGYSTRDLPYFRTIHSMCFRALGLKDGEVAGYEALCTFGRGMGLTFGRSSASEVAAEGVNASEEGDHMLALHHLARARGRTLRQTWNDARSGVDWVKVDHFGKSYDAWKRESALLDFTDVLTEFVRRAIVLPLDVAFIDEAQDLSLLQWLAAMQATVGCRVQYVAGDDDQAIYRWAGADVDYFMRLQGERRVLSHSYRLPRRIHSLSQRVVRRIRDRVQKEFSGREEEGEVLRHAHMDGIDLAAGTQWLWLVRNRYLIPRLRGWLENRGVIFMQHGASSVTDSDRDAIYTWERLRAGKMVEATSVRTMYAKMVSGEHIKRGYKLLPGVDDRAPITLADLQASHGLVADTTLPWFEVLLGIALERRMYYRAIVARHGSLRKAPLVQVETIHGAKGTEAENVVVWCEQSRRVYTEAFDTADDEHRVWYVAMTRARERLHVVESTSRWAYHVPFENHR